jgi:ABC-type transporter Mla subunit MlaD
MRLELNQLNKILSNSQRDFPDLYRSIAAELGRVNKLSKRANELEAEFRGLTARLAGAAERGDTEEAAELVATLPRVMQKKAEVEAEINRIVNGASTLLAPVSDALNAAIAVAPVLAVLRDQFMHMDSMVRDRIVEAAPNIAW